MAEGTDGTKSIQDYEAERSKELRLVRLEAVAWFGITVTCGAIAAMFIVAPFPYVGDDYRMFAVLFGAWAIFPLLFKQVFGQFPGQWGRAARRRRSTKGADGLTSWVDIAWGGEVEVVESPPLASDPSMRAGDTDVGLKALAGFVSRSGDLARSIYNRAGVYLVVGVIVALGGLGYFYVVTSEEILGPGLAWEAALMKLGPRFGILFFIEFIAFFFLRQYRSAMDEFRYFEAIQRHREELTALVLLADRAEEKFDLKDLLAKGMYYSGRQVLGKDETTEIIESRKLEKNEIELLEKIIDTVGKRGGKD